MIPFKDVKIRISDLPEIKSDFILDSLELLSMPDFCSSFGLMFPLQREPEAIARYSQLLRQLILKQRQGRIRQVSVHKVRVIQRLLLCHYEVMRIRQTLGLPLNPSWLCGLLLSFLHERKPFSVWQRGLLVVLVFLLYPYLYFIWLIILCQPQLNSTVWCWRKPIYIGLLSVLTKIRKFMRRRNAHKL